MGPTIRKNSLKVGSLIVHNRYQFYNLQKVTPIIRARPDTQSIVSQDKQSEVRVNLTQCMCKRDLPTLYGETGIRRRYWCRSIPTLLHSSAPGKTRT